MKKIFILFGLLLFYQHLTGGEPDRPDLLIEKTVDRQAIGWFWRGAPDGFIYPFLKIHVNQLVFLNPDGEVIHQSHLLPGSKIVTSKNQEYLGFFDVDEDYPIDEDRKAVRGLRYHITSFTGEGGYSIPLEVPYDDPIPALYLANDGSSFLADSYRGTIKIIASDGTTGESIDLFADDLLDYEKPISCAIANDGSLFAVLAQKRPMSFDSNSSTFTSGEPYLFCFDFDGNQLLKKPLELMTAAEVAISPSGKFIVVSQYSPEQEKKSTVFNLVGEIILEVPTLFRQAQFASNESRLFLADRKSLYFVDLSSSSYSKRALIDEREDRMIIELLSNDRSDEILVVTATSVFQNGRFEYIEPGVIKLNGNGNRLWELKFEQEKFVTPSFYINKNQFGLGFELDYKIYRDQSE